MGRLRPQGLFPLCCVISVEGQDPRDVFARINPSPGGDGRIEVALAPTSQALPGLGEGVSHLRGGLQRAVTSEAPAERPS